MIEHDIATVFTRWTTARAMLHRGYWLVASLYLVLDAELSPAQLVFLGTAQGIRLGVNIADLVYHAAVRPATISAGCRFAGMGDLVWHEILGIEIGVEALLSPTHLLLLVAGNRCHSEPFSRLG